MSRISRPMAALAVLALVVIVAEASTFTMEVRYYIYIYIYVSVLTFLSRPGNCGFIRGLQRFLHINLDLYQALPAHLLLMRIQISKTPKNTHRLIAIARADCSPIVLLTVYFLSEAISCPLKGRRHVCNPCVAMAHPTRTAFYIMLADVNWEKIRLQ